MLNINVRKHAINDKLQGSVATYLRYGGLLITKLRNVYCSVYQLIFVLNRWIFGKNYKQEGDCFVHLLRLLAVW